jgi:hypothetical protein
LPIANWQLPISNKDPFTVSEGGKQEVFKIGNWQSAIGNDVDWQMGN